MLAFVSQGSPRNISNIRGRTTDIFPEMLENPVGLALAFPASFDNLRQRKATKSTGVELF